MLGKLMKYEWKATWKLLVCANAFTLVMTIFAWIMVKVLVSSSNNLEMMDFMAVIGLFTYAGSLFAVCVGTAIYLIHRFYTSTYGDQGYLLHTLPVDTHYIIIAKVLVSTAWELINIVFVYLSVTSLIALAGDFVTFQSFRSMVESTIERLGAGKITAFTLIMTLIAFLFSVFARVLKVGACISLGQLSSNHKLMLSFAWYIGIYVVEQIVQVLYFAVMVVFHKRLSGATYYSYFDSQWEMSLIAGIISCVVFYLLTWYVMSRKLNLE